MPAPESPQPAMFDRLAALASSVMRLIYTRVELAGLELAIERDVVMQRAETALIGAVSAGLAGLSLVLIAALALPEQYRRLALGALATLFAAIAVFAWLRHRQLLASTRPMFASTVHQFQQDCETLESVRAQPDRGQDSR